jgi:hypothetical protein
MTFKPPCEPEALADYIITFLNELVAADPALMHKLVETRVPCNEVIAEHPTVQVVKEGNGYVVGLLGILNGIVGARPEDGYGYIAAHFDDDECTKFTGFVRTSPPKQDAR